MDGTRDSGDAAPAGPETAGLEPRTTNDGSRTLFDPEAGQSFHSGHGAVREARHVYLRASGVADRLAGGRATRVLEVGLGSGLNLLLSCDAAIAGGAQLHSRALERRPPPVERVRELGFAAQLRRPKLAEAWLALLAELGARPDRPGVVRAPEGALGPGITLEVGLGDACRDARGRPSDVAATLLEPGWADALYHDAFSRAASPELWSDAFLGACATALAPDGAWVSYSVAGAVRRSLAGHGLAVAKMPGPEGGKREMLRAVRPRGSAHDPTASPRR